MCWVARLDQEVRLSTRGCLWVGSKHSRDRFCLIRIEHDFSEETTRRVVHVNNRVLGSLESLESPLDQIRSSRREDLDPNIVGDLAVVDEVLNELEIRLRRSGVRDLNLLESEFY